MRSRIAAACLAFAALPGLSNAGDEWTSHDAGPQRWFGFSVATADGWRLSGAPLESLSGQQTGAAYLLDTTIPGGVERKIHPMERVPGQRFGWSVAISKNVMVIGAPGNGTMVGEAYVFERMEDRWYQSAILTGVPGHGGDEFGAAVAVVDDRILVGAPKDSARGHQAGAVYAFRRGRSLWGLEQVLYGDHTAAGDQFGFALAMDDDRVVVGAFSANIQVFNEGAAYVFKHADTGYKLEAELWAIEPRPNSMFGRAVGILGDRIAVGATEDHWSDIQSGAVTVYANTDDGWVAEDRVLAPNEELGNAFGYSLALQPEGLVVGAPLADVDGVESGAAYVLHPTGSAWGVTQTLYTEYSPGQGDYIGVSVSIAEDGAIVGAMRNLSKGYNAGAVHLFSPDEYDVPMIYSFCGCDEGGECGSDPQEFGCENSTGHGGRLTALGTTSISRDDLVLRAENLPKKAYTYFVAGIPGKETFAFDGKLCLAPIGKDYTVLGFDRASKRGEVTSSVKVLSLLQQSGATAMAGTTFAFQAIYYDRKGPCRTEYNITDALSVTLTP